MTFSPDLRIQKILRDMWGNKPRLVLVVLSIAVGIFTVGTLIRTQAIVSREFRNAYLTSNPAQGTISVGQGFDSDFLKTIAAMPEVKEAEGRYWQTVRVRVGANPWESMQLHLRTDYDNQQVHKVRPAGGSWPPPERTLLLERSSLSLIKAKIGDTLTLDMQNGRQRDIVVSGLAYDIEQVPSNFVNVAYGYVTAETYEWLLGQPVKYDVLQITLPHPDADKAQVEHTLALIGNKFKNGGISSYSTDVPSGKHELDDIVKALLLILVIVGLLSLVFSAFLVVNIITAVLARQVAQIGVMKTLGMQSGSVMLLYFGQIFISGLLALLLAVPFSTLAARGLSIFLAGLLNFDVTDFQVPWYAYAGELLAGLVMPFLAGLFPILGGTRITVREAIAQTGGGNQFGTGKIDQFLKKLGNLPEPLLYAFRNILRQKMRLTFTLVTLVLAGAIFISVIGTRASLLLTIDNLANYWQQDVTLRIDETRLARAEREALRVPGVAAFEGRLVTSGVRLRPDGQRSGRHIVFGVFPNSQFLTPTIIAGRWLQPDDTNAIVINLPLLKEEPDISVGDVVEYEVDDQLISGPVVGIVTGQAVGASRFMDPILHVNYDFLTRATGQAGLSNRALIKAKKNDAAFQTQVANAVDDHFQQIGINTNQKETNTTRRALIRNIFAVLLSVLFVLAILFVVVGGMSLTGMMSLSVLERTVEIGILRAIGGSGWFVAQIVMVEGLFIGLLSWGLGVLLALPLSKFLSDIIGNTILSTPLDYTFSFIGVLLWLVIALLISAVAAFIPARNASRLSVRETLSYE